MECVAAMGKIKAAMAKKEMLALKKLAA